MYSKDWTNSMDTPEVSSAFASQIVSTPAWSLQRFDLCDMQVPSTGGIIQSVFQTYRIETGDSTVVGYSLDAEMEQGRHFVRLLDSLTQEQRDAKLLRFACHYLVDATPDSGLHEVLEKVSEMKEYYCSLQNWHAPALPPVTSLETATISNSFERAPFSYPEE